MNCDGAAKRLTGPAGGGGVRRDHQGTLVPAYHTYFGNRVAYKAEVLALIKGLELAKNLEIKKLEIHMDNLVCVQFLNNNDKGR